MPELLTGTVTFLFTDIEGSTRLAASRGEAWGSLLERHRVLLRRAWASHEGSEVGTEGDSFFVAFATAPAAVAAAVDAQRALAAEPWPPDGEVRVRMGMHTGEAGFSAKTYAGLNVHRAARVAGVAHGGQVLISDATRALVGEDLPPGVELRDLGVHRLKDLDHPEHLWQLVVAGLENEFPPPRSLDAMPNNLPTRLTSFLGRQREAAEIDGLLSNHRLLTLTGPGGTGKTRLSLEVAGRRLTEHPGGVFFVELATITDPDLVVPTIAKTLSLPDRGGRTPMERLSEYIGDREVLLVLDNFEQVADAAPAVVALLAACPNLVVLVSSRVVLHVSGEQEYLVPPLGLPDPQHLPPLDQLSQYESVALFIERARGVQPGFSLTDGNAAAVAEICVRLDGLPLAIELAAARIRILSPQAMLGRLNDRLGLLSGGSRDLPARQQTLRGAIAWSHDLLDDEDRALFACLSVFAGGAGLPAIERVCSPEIRGDLLDSLGSLVEKSLLRRTEGVGGEPRFSMLQTIHEYAAEQAAAAGRSDELRATHAGAFADLVAQAAPLVMSADKRVWLDRLAEEHDNLRAAIGWAMETDDATGALTITARLWRFWQMRGYLSEALERIEAALAMPGASDLPQLQADAMDAAAGIAYWQADAERSRAWYEREIEIRRRIGDRAGEAGALYGTSFTWTIGGASVVADESGLAHARDAIDRALLIYRDLGDESGVGLAEWSLSNVCYAAGDFEGTWRHAIASREIFARLGNQFMEGWSIFTMGIARLWHATTDPSSAADDVAQAEDLLRRSLRIFVEADDVSAYTLVLDALATSAFRAGRVERSARLAGAASRLERTTGTGLNVWNRTILGFVPETYFATPELEACVAVGEAMSVEEAVAYALAD